MRITKEEGPAAFYRGVVPFTQRAMLVGACQVATFDEFKQRYAKLMPTVAPTGSYSNVFVVRQHTCAAPQPLDPHAVHPAAVC